ncbi:hypothetical protein AB0M45_32865 [Nocardia sp. NPDC051787]|uniref:hypothetical protein n=1 Tax=Nocardia sp. NPDC051787 TaxID=3155415 RepID=UPI003441069F
MTLWSRLFWAIVVDLANVVAWAAVAVLIARGRRTARAFEQRTDLGGELWCAHASEITDRIGNRVWVGHKARRHRITRRRLVSLIAAEAGMEFRVRAEDGILHLDRRDGTAAGRIEADRCPGTRLGYTVYDGAGSARAVIANTSVADSSWAVTGTDQILYARFVLAVGGHRLAFEPEVPAELRPLLAAFLLDYGRMLLEAGSGPVSVADLYRRTGAGLRSNSLPRRGIRRGRSPRRK